MAVKNIKNLASAMLLKYAIILIYFLGLASAMSGYMGIFVITVLLCFVLIVFKVYYDLKFISGELKK